MKKLITSLTLGLMVAVLSSSYQPTLSAQTRQKKSHTSVKAKKKKTSSSSSTSCRTKVIDSLATDSLPPTSKDVGVNLPTDSVLPSTKVVGGGLPIDSLTPIVIPDSLTEEIIYGDTTLLELPRLAGVRGNYFVTHHASGVVNYSLEYDISKLHARWVAFSFDSKTSGDSISRTNAWSWDPKVPKAYDTSTFFRHSGYSRGHLVASEDRIYSREANEQTFYYTNMSPQLQSHNAGVWHRLENKVQQWGRDRNFCDKLYVAKGATIREDQIEEKRLAGKVVIPRYFWMAVLMKKGSSYHAIAFLTEHRNYARNEHIEDMTLSVQELEKFTGLDFFYHLPDKVEKRVEKVDPKTPEARRIWWSK